MEKRRVLLVSSSLVATALLVACQNQNTPESQRIVLLSPSEERIELMVEIADEPQERSRGLMFRESLEPDTGMLFVFENEQMLSFWMKDTLIPLDILFFDRDWGLVSTTTMRPCKKDPCQTYPSEGPALYALEVKAGFVAENGVGEGWRLAW